MELHELLESVEDDASFLVFVRALRSDLRMNGASWENVTIEQFLDAALSWAESSDFGASMGLTSASPWKRVATMLYCGKIYE